jgi:hypothetical protein
MSWLRRQQDIASLFAVWALLFQVLLGPFAMAGHAYGATSLAGGIICTTRGLVAGPGTTLPKQTRHNGDCPGCSHACRIACGASPIAALAAVNELPLPPLALGPADKAPGTFPVGSDRQADFQSRAPPYLG